MHEDARVGRIVDEIVGWDKEDFHRKVFDDVTQSVYTHARYMHSPHPQLSLSDTRTFV